MKCKICSKETENFVYIEKTERVVCEECLKEMFE